MSADAPHDTERSRAPNRPEKLLFALFVITGALYLLFFPVASLTDLMLGFASWWYRTRFLAHLLIAVLAAVVLVFTTLHVAFRYWPSLVDDDRDVFRHLACAKGLRSLNVALLVIGAGLSIAYLFHGAYAPARISFIIMAGLTIAACLIQTCKPLPPKHRVAPEPHEAGAVDPSDLVDKAFRWNYAQPSSARGGRTVPVRRSESVTINMARYREVAASTSPTCTLDELTERILGGDSPEVRRVAACLADWDEANDCCTYDSVCHIVSFTTQFVCQSHTCLVPESGQVACPYPVQVLAEGRSPDPVGILALGATLARVLGHNGAIILYSDHAGQRLALAVEADRGARGQLLDDPQHRHRRYYFCRVTGCEGDGTPRWSMGEVPSGITIHSIDRFEGLRD